MHGTYAWLKPVSHSMASAIDGPSAPLSQATCPGLPLTRAVPDGPAQSTNPFLMRPPERAVAPDALEPFTGILHLARCIPYAMTETTCYGAHSARKVGTMCDVSPMHDRRLRIVTQRWNHDPIAAYLCVLGRSQRTPPTPARANVASSTRTSLSPHSAGSSSPRSSFDAGRRPQRSRAWRRILQPYTSAPGGVKRKRTWSEHVRHGRMPVGRDPDVADQPPILGSLI